MADFINTIDVVGDDALVDSIIDKSITEFRDNTLETIGGNTFVLCKKLTTVDLPVATRINEGAFWFCSSLTGVNLPVAKDIGAQTFRSCGQLQSITLPAATSIGLMAFYDSDALEKVDLPAATSILGSSFAQCNKIATVILRNNAVCSLANANAFENTPISKGTGYIYIPSALKEQYAQSTNWSVYAAQFRALEDYTVDGTIWGDLDENKI